MSDVQVIRATREHVPAIRAMVQAAYSKYVERIGRPPAPMLADYEKILDEGVQEVWVLVLQSTSVKTIPSSSPPNSVDEQGGQQKQQTSGAGGQMGDNRSPPALGSVIVAPDSHCAAAIKVNNLVVDPDSQGKGYGRVLMGFAEELARSRGLDKLTLFTNVMMWENIGLYAKLGFSETGRRVEDGYERVYFEKRLEG
ncbi:acetyltransferase protein [Apiospora arundinis]|uniref:Acetyltransferase protein n=1 Tax=Apiospora arundinis TaxID=335852 RepID=A0ABR2HKU6_9PEZI